MPETAAFAHLPKIFHARLSDVAIAFWRKSHSSTEPSFLSKLHNLVERVPSRVVCVCEIEFLRRYVARVNLLDIAINHRASEWIFVDHLSKRTYPVSAKRCCRKTNDFRSRKSLKDFRPAGRYVMMTFINKNHVKVIWGKLG